MSYTIEGGWIVGKLPGPGNTMIPVVKYPRADMQPWSKLTRTPHLCLHTTEGTTTLGDAYKRWEYPPNFAVGDGKIVQLFPLDYASEAVDSHDHELMQIEIPYRVGGKPVTEIWLPPVSSLHPLIALVAFLHDEGYITTGLQRPNEDWPLQLDRGPQASESYYRRRDGTWPKPGVYGHVEIPDDEHWDPGSFNYPEFFKLVREVLGGEDEMFEQWRAGWTAHEEGKQLKPEWPAPKRQGWRDREQVIKEAVARAKAPVV